MKREKEKGKRKRLVERASSTFFLLHVAFLLAGPRVFCAAGEIIDRVLAVVAGELITLTDVTAARDLGLIVPPASDDPTRAVLSRLIDRELILAEVERYAPREPTADAIDAEVNTVRARFTSQEAFDAVLARSGVDDKHLRETLRQNLRIRAYEEQRFTVGPPNDEELATYYRDHPQAFTRDGRLMPFADARADVARAVMTERRQALIADWVAGLRRRAEISDLYASKR